MRRVIAVLSVMVAMMAAPAFAKTIIGDPPPGPPALTGNFPNGATVTHCNGQNIGQEGAIVFNKNGINGQGNCLE
jgi:hypothetical protein